jgi:hypothetical protein
MNIHRRQVVAGALAASAVGLTASGVEASTSTSGLAPLVVQATGLRLATAGRAAPPPGDSVVLNAALSADTPGGGPARRGSLHGVYLVIDASGVVGTAAPTSIETHHFVFADGTIVGTGTASLDDSEDHFVIVGGTGAFAGASGSYTAVQRPLGLGGDGTATYRFAFASADGR